MNIHVSDTKKMWCPFSRATLYVRGDQKKGSKPLSLVGHGSNRLSTDDPEINKRIEAALDLSGATRCLGTRCMAWLPLDLHHGRCGLVYGKDK